MPTEAKEIFEATSRSFRELMSENGLGFYIPAYQRPYGWDTVKVARLIDDTLHGLAILVHSDDSFTFLGTIITIHDINHTTVHPKVKDEVPGKVLTVIDGQQRLCSLLLMAVCLHNQMRLRHSRMFKPGKPMDVAHDWLNGQSLQVLKTLATTIYEAQAYGDAPIYPRMIRAFKDQWSRKKQYAQYESPIANLLANYSTMAESETPADFRPKPRDGGGEGESDLVKRYMEIRIAVNNLAKGKSEEGRDEIPDLPGIAHNKAFQRALLSHDFPDEVVKELTNPAESYAELIRLLFLGAYVLNRIAVTVVKGKNEDYAFTIFESLNTTGEPLTAFETFKPRVVSAEGLADYESSEARALIDGIGDYLSGFKVGSTLQTATQELLTSFANAETGHKLAKRLSDQRSWLKEEFERHSDDQAARVAFVQHLRDTARFVQHSWEPGREGEPHLFGLPPQATTDGTRLCLAFLASLKHTIAVGPLVRFYAEALASPAEHQLAAAKDFEGAIKAIAAFSILWRTSRRNTGNIDREYREIMTGVESTHIGPLARSRRRGHEDGPSPEVSLSGLKKELLARLKDPGRGGVSGKDQWIRLSSALPIYQTNKALARFILLCAYHDAVEDQEFPGLVLPGKANVNRCLDFQGWRDEAHLSLEHIVPQEATSEWPEDLYSDKDTVHQLGNLVMTPGPVNSSLGNRPWDEKRILYAALGAPSKEKARQTLEKAAATGITFNKPTEELVARSRHLPHLVSLGQRTSAWDPEFVLTRSSRLFELSWDRLAPWLAIDEA
ncbi:DUF262 domain-containing protein [Micromonospora haikouensis]|uniref:DUF262 domain-containing protein n=1 Tax=Micromonospora haikouensis TaxID=686309 RepID=UPI003D71A126